jgi:hypothetical protein
MHVEVKCQRQVLAQGLEIPAREPWSQCWGEQALGVTSLDPFGGSCSQLHLTHSGAEAECWDCPGVTLLMNFDTSLRVTS